MKLLPLGTIIRVNEHNVCIIGYGSGKNEKVTGDGYLVVSYPLGFTNIDKTFFIPHNYDFEIIAEGYKTEASSIALNIFGLGLEKLQNASEEDLEKLNDAFTKMRAAKKEAAEK